MDIQELFNTAFNAVSYELEVHSARHGAGPAVRHRVRVQHRTESVDRHRLRPRRQAASAI